MLPKKISKLVREEGFEPAVGYTVTGNEASYPMRQTSYDFVAKEDAGLGMKYC